MPRHVIQLFLPYAGDAFRCHIDIAIDMMLIRQRYCHACYMILQHAAAVAVITASLSPFSLPSGAMALRHAFAAIRCLLFISFFALLLCVLLMLTICCRYDAAIRV